MKQSKTLTNEELGEQVMAGLEDQILKTCTELIETIDMQLRKKKYCLTESQQEALKDYIRNKVNLNVTINVGIGINELDKADIFPTPVSQKKLELSFETKEEKVTLSKKHIEKLDNAAKALRSKSEEDEAFKAERKKRAAEVAQA